MWNNQLGDGGSGIYCCSLLNCLFTYIFLDFKCKWLGLMCLWMGKYWIYKRGETSSSLVVLKYGPVVARGTLLNSPIRHIYTYLCVWLDNGKFDRIRVCTVIISKASWFQTWTNKVVFISLACTDCFCWVSQNLIQAAVVLHTGTLRKVYYS